MESSDSQHTQENLVGELKQVQNELQNLESTQTESNSFLFENLSSKQVEQYIEGIKQRDEIIRSFQSKLEETQTQFKQEKLKFEKEIEDLHHQLRNVCPQIALQDDLLQDGATKRHRELQEKLLQIQEERFIEKEQHQTQLEHLKELNKQLQLEQQNKTDMELKFNHQSQTLKNENENLRSKLVDAETEIETLKVACIKEKNEYQQNLILMENNVLSLESSHKAAMEELRAQQDASALLIEQEMEDLQKLHQQNVDCVSKQLKESNSENAKLTENLKTYEDQLKQVQTENEKLHVQVEELILLKEETKTSGETPEDETKLEKCEKSELKSKFERREEIKMGSGQNSIERCTVADFKLLLSNLWSLLNDIEKPDRNLLNDLEVSNKKLTDSMLLLSEMLKSSSSNKKDSNLLSCHSSQADSAMSEVSFCSPTSLISPPTSLPLCDETGLPGTQRFPPASSVRKFDDQLQRASDDLEDLLLKCMPDSSFPRIAPITYIGDQQCTSSQPVDDIISSFINHQQSLMEAFHNLLESVDIEPKDPTSNTTVARWMSVCKTLCMTLKNADNNGSQLKKDEKDYQQMLFKLMCQVTIQLLHYYSVSQNHMDKDNDLAVVESNENDPMSPVTKGDIRRYETLSLSFDNSMDLPGDPVDEVCLNTTAVSEEILEDLDKDQQVKNTLKSSLCPNLMAVLKGKPAGLQELEAEIQEFTISLQARIGMLKIYMHSNNFVNPEEKLSQENPTNYHSLMNSCFSSNMDKSTLGITLKENVMNDQCQIECLLADLQKERDNSEELKRKLHETQGLLFGSQEETAELQRDKQDLEDRIVKLTQELQGGGIILDETEQTKGIQEKVYVFENQDLQKKARAYLSSKDLAALNKEQLKERISHLELLLEELSTESAKTIEQLNFNEQDLLQQLQAADKKIRSSRQFIDEQVAERDREFEHLVAQNNKLKNSVREKEMQLSSFTDLQEEIKDLREIIQNLEAQLANKSALADELATKIEALQQTQNDSQSTCEEVVSLHSSSKSPELRRDSREHGNDFPGDFGMSIDEEMQNDSHAWNNSNQRIADFVKKIDKMASALESTGFGSEEALSDRSEIQESSTLSDPLRPLSPSSWEHILEEKFHNVECGMETVLKNNRDIKMSLKNAQQELKELSDEYDSLVNQIKEKDETILDLKTQMELKEDHLREMEDQKAKLSSQIDLNEKLKRNIDNIEAQLHQTKKQLVEILSERDCLQKTNSKNLMTISSLQARVDDFKRSDPSIESALKATVSSLKEENTKKDNALSANFKQINAQRNAMNELNEKLILREEEIEKLKRKLSYQDMPKKAGHELLIEHNISQIEVQRADYSNMSSGIMNSVILPVEEVSSKGLSRTMETPAKSLLAMSSPVLEEVKEVTPERSQSLETTQENTVISQEAAGIPKSPEAVDVLREQILRLTNEKEEILEVCKVKEESHHRVSEELKNSQENITKLEKEIEQIRSTMKEHLEKSNQMEHDFAKISKLNQELQREGVLLKKKIKDQTRLEDQIRNLEATNEELKRRLRTEDERITNSQKQELLDLRLKIESLTSKNSELSSELEDLRLQNARHAENLLHTTKKNDEAKAILEEKIVAMSASLADSELKIKQLEEELKASQSVANRGVGSNLGNSNETAHLSSSRLNQSSKLDEILDKLRSKGLEILSHAELVYLENCRSGVLPEISLSGTFDTTTPLSANSTISEAELTRNSSKKCEADSYEEASGSVSQALLNEKAKTSKLKSFLESMKKESKELREKLHTERVQNCDILAEKNVVEEKFIIFKKSMDITAQDLSNIKKEKEILEHDLEVVRAHLQEERDQFNLVSQTLNYQRKISADNDHHQRNLIEDLKKSLEREKKRVLELLSRRSLSSSVISLDREEREKSLEIDASVSGSRRRSRMSQSQQLESDDKVQQLEDNINTISMQNRRLNLQLEAKTLEARDMKAQMNALLEENKSLSANVHRVGSWDIRESQIVLRQLRERENEIETLKNHISSMEHQLELVLLQGHTLEHQNIEGLTLDNIKRINDLVNFHRKQNLELFRKLLEITSKPVDTSELDAHKQRIIELEAMLELQKANRAPYINQIDNVTANVQQLLTQKNQMESELQAATQLNSNLYQQINMLKSSDNHNSVSSDGKYKQLFMKMKRIQTNWRSLIWQKKYLLHVLTILHREQDQAMDRVVTITHRIQKSISFDVSLPRDLPKLTVLGRFRVAVNAIIFIKRVQTVKLIRYKKLKKVEALQRDGDSIPSSPTSLIMHNTEVMQTCSDGQPLVVGFSPPTKDTDCGTDVRKDISDTRRKLFDSQGLDEYVERIGNINSIMGITSPKRKYPNLRR